MFFTDLTRRSFVQVGIAGGLGMSSLLSSQSSLSKSPKATSLIHIWLGGGMSHSDSWDHKQFAPSEYRGPFAGIKTKIDGAVFSELFKNTAAISDQLTVIRSMTHGQAAHELGVHDMLTGYRPSPAIKYPSMGSIVSHELGGRNSIPPYVVIPNTFAPENGSGYLSTAFGPFSIGSNPEDPGFNVRDLKPPSEINDMRSDRRKSLLSAVDEHFRKREKSDALTAMDKFYGEAYDLVSSTQAREAFDLKSESQATKNMYGNNAAGMRLLLARRLVQAGVRLITVTYGSWDHHSGIKTAMENNATNFDKAFAALIHDLKVTGMLDSTLVLVSSEFGRTPKINASGGRDHHPRVFSVVMAGGGIKRGFAYGSSDTLGGEPDLDPVTPEDLAATVYSQLGIDPTKRLMTSDNRPIDIVKNGSILPITA